mgnify:CR=1 FL=1
MGVHDDHRRRVYERFLREGLAGFEEHNAMEFLLFLARPRGDTNPLAHALIDRFGSLSAVLDAPIEELERVPGVGHSSAVALKFIPQMCAYYLENKTSHKVPLTSVEEASAFFYARNFFARTQEAFYMAAVDDRRVLLRCVLISEGSANATAVSVAKVVSEALKCGATGVMLAHNHPRGITLPSSSDMAVTREIYRALRLVNIQLVEHLILRTMNFFLVQSNYMDSIRQSVQD